MNGPIDNLDRVHVDTIKELPTDWFSIGYFRWVFPLEEYLSMSKGLFSKSSKEICSYCVDVVSNIVAQNFHMHVEENINKKRGTE